MRVRKRYAVMLAIAAMIGAVVTYQAVTATPPEPYVRLVGVVPSPPVAVYGCSADEGQMIHYTTGDGRQLEPAPTGHPCGYAGLGPTTPGR
jgi:hypothetical protein